MYRKMLLKTLIGQEKRSAILFISLSLTIIFAIDLFISIHSSDKYGVRLLFPYLFLYLQIPLVIVLIKKGNPRYIKYTFFITYTLLSLVNEVVMYWGTTDYKGGLLIEMFFILFSPIFINKRFCWVVTLGILVKYSITGIFLQTLIVLNPIGITLVFAVIIFIILSRFTGYMNAINSSYFKQFESVVKGIVSTLELKDPYTRGHSERVAEYAVLLADSLDIYRKEDLDLIYYACLLHDVGKVHTPDSILTKPTRLTDEEYAIVKQHPFVGAKAIKDIEGMELCLDIVLYHHERWDGKGYPEGLNETKIPLTARIAAIADSFDAMTSHRSYRRAMTADQAYHQIMQGKGTQFDPALIEHFQKAYPDLLKLLDERNSKSQEFSEVAVSLQTS